MKQTTKSVLNHPSVKKGRIVWLSSVVFGFSNVVSETEMVKHLSKRVWKVNLFAMAPTENEIESDPHFILFPMKFISVITFLFYNLALLICMPFYLVIKKPDYVITDKGTTISGFVLKLFLRLLRFKIVLDIRSTPLQVRNTFREHLEALLFRISVVVAKKSFDGITTLTELMKDEICSKFGINPNIVGVWSSGVSAILFNPENSNREEIRKEFGLSDRFVVFYHGAMRRPGLVETIEAIKAAKTEHPDVVLFLLGGRPRESVFLENPASETGVQSDVMWHDKVNYTDVPKFVAMCDLAIVPLPDSPNWRYQCPLKLLEYLAMKKVVIVTDIPANREVIGENKCGIYVPSVDPADIQKAIAYARNNWEKLKEWGSFGRAIIEKRYTWEKIAEDFEDYLLSL